jgi:hypothetical protein
VNCCLPTVIRCAGISVDITTRRRFFDTFERAPQLILPTKSSLRRIAVEFSILAHRLPCAESKMKPQQRIRKLDQLFIFALVILAGYQIKSQNLSHKTTLASADLIWSTE